MSGRIAKKYQDLICECFNKGQKPMEIFRYMRKVHGRESPCEKTVTRYWRQMNEKKETNRRNQDLRIEPSLEQLEELEPFRTRPPPLPPTITATTVEDNAKTDDDLEIIFVKQETENQVLQGPQPEKILGDFIQNGQRFFLVKWKTQAENTTVNIIH